MTKEDYYIIVCRDLHGAVGVFANYEDALKAARAYTDAGKQQGASCTFLPCPIDEVDRGSFRKVKDPTPKEDSGHIGQYL